MMPVAERSPRNGIRSWWSRFLTAAAVLAVGMAGITAALMAIGWETRPMGVIASTGLIYCIVFSAIHASAPTWRERLHKGD